MSDFEDRVRRDLKRSADAVEPPPLLWRRVEDRLGHRDRRAVAFLAAAVVIVAAIAVLAVARNDGGGSEKHVASEAPSTTEPQGVVVPAEPETTTTEPTTTVATAPAAPSTTRTTTTHATTTTTLTPTTCKQEDLSFTTTTDKSTYAPGETVTITETIKNVSNGACNYEYGACPTAGVKDAGNNWVWSSWDSRGSAVCPAIGYGEYLDPGAVAKTHHTDVWNQRVCEGPTATTTTSTAPTPCGGSPAPPGEYSAWMQWDEPTKPAFFQIS